MTRPEFNKIRTMLEQEDDVLLYKTLTSLKAYPCDTDERCIVVLKADRFDKAEQSVKKFLQGINKSRS